MNNLNNSSIFLGFMILISSLGDNCIEKELSPTCKKYIKNSTFRKFAIFAMLFMILRDISLAITFTAGYLLLNNIIR